MRSFAPELLGADVYPALYRDLSERAERVSAFFPSPPEDRAAWGRRAAAVTANWAEDGGSARRRALVAALTRHHARLGVRPAQQSHLEALGRQDALVVVTGQQAGLLGGPLYTAYKALGAIVRAAEAQRQLGCPVVPVFWVASEDHDWSEVSRAACAAPDGALVRLRLQGDGGFRSAGHIPLPHEARHLVGRLTSLFPPRGDGAAAAEALQASLQRPGRPTLADWFTTQLQSLFGEAGLLFYDPMLPDLRALAAPVFSGAVERAPAANAAIVSAGEALAMAGYEPGLELEPDHVHLFAYHQGRRVALHAVDGRVRTRDGAVDLEARAAARLAAAEPAGFSPNVALRPIVQAFTLPVLCQLGGPGEVAYLAQLGGVFSLWGLEAPIVAPRPGATILLPADVDALAAAGAPVLSLRSDLEGMIDRAVAARCPVDIADVFAAERRALAERYGQLRTVLAAVGPAMPVIVDGNAERVTHQLDYLERKARQHRRRTQRELAASLRAAAGRLFPAGGLQERSSLIYPYLFSEGPGFLAALREVLAAVPGPIGRHWLLRWEP